MSWVLSVKSSDLITHLFRWCQILDDDIYEPVVVQSQQPKEEKKRIEIAVVSFQGLGEKYEKSFYEESTYGQVRERGGRRGEMVQEGEGAWSGRVEQRRHWRGRSKERRNKVVSLGDHGEVWRGRSPEPGEAGGRQNIGEERSGTLSTKEEDWRGRSPGPGGGEAEWRGRVWSEEREGERLGPGQWRGRSPGLGDITATGETWV